MIAHGHLSHLRTGPATDHHAVALCCSSTVHPHDRVSFTRTTGQPPSWVPRGARGLRLRCGHTSDAFERPGDALARANTSEDG